MQQCTVEELGRQALQKWHTFFLQVSSNPYTTGYWSQVLGREQVVMLPRTEDLAVVQAAIIGLTEGVLDLQSVPDFLAEARVNRRDAMQIVRAVSNIPLRAQAMLPNFDRIPLKGSIFASREDIWPINGSQRELQSPPLSRLPDRHLKKGEEINWQL